MEKMNRVSDQIKVGDYINFVNSSKHSYSSNTNVGKIVFIGEEDLVFERFDSKYLTLLKKNDVSLDVEIIIDPIIAEDLDGKPVLVKKPQKKEANLCYHHYLKS